MLWDKFRVFPQAPTVAQKFPGSRTSLPAPIEQSVGGGGGKKKRRGGGGKLRKKKSKHVREIDLHNWKAVKITNGIKNLITIP